MGTFPGNMGGAMSGAGGGVEAGGEPGDIKFGKDNSPKGEEDATSPETLNPYDDLRAVSERIDKLLTVSRFMRPQFERDWFRNMLFWAGVQWIVEDRGRWRPRNLPTWFPRAMTNKFAEKVNDLCAAILQNGRVPINYLPSTDDAEDKAIAEISSTIRDTMYEEAGIDEVDEELARWVVITGNGFLHPYYDEDPKHGVETYPNLLCQNCQQVNPPDMWQGRDLVCPNCQAQGQAVKDPAGTETSYPLGRFQTKCFAPFEVHIDHRVRRWKDHRRFIWMELVDVDQVQEEVAPELKDKIIADDANTDLGMFYLESMAQITSSYGRTTSLPGGITSTASARQAKTMKYHFYELPTNKFPLGLHAVRVGTSKDLVIKAEPLPDRYGAGARKGQPFLPLAHFGFDIMPGRAWNKTRMDDLIALQMFRNIIDANLRLTVQRMGNSIWMNPKGSGVSIFTGAPGQVIGYNPISFGGSSFAKPERVPPDLSGVAALIALLSKIDDAMERVAGTFFLAGGDTPPGVTAASALAYLGERSQRAMSTFARSWAKSWKDWEAMGLEIYREHADQARVMTVVGKNRQWEIQQFTKDDLSGGVRMQIDYNGLFPKSQATERATIAQLATMMFVTPGDPEMEQAVLEKFGESDLKPSTDKDTREAVKENEAFMDAAQAIDPQEVQELSGVMQQAQQTQQQPPSEVEQRIDQLTQSVMQTLDFVPIVQNSQVHLREHTDLAKTEEFKALPDQAKQIMYQHIEIHMHDLEAQKAMAAPPPGSGGGGAGGGSAPAAKPGGPQGPGGTRSVQQPRNVSPEQANQPPDLLASAMEPNEAQPPGAAGM